jgi:DNA invertase Pin-like site-specific DNA recombinase
MTVIRYARVSISDQDLSIQEAALRAAGCNKGRPSSIDVAKVRELNAQGLGPAKIAKAMGIARASVYRALLGLM